MTTNDAFQQLQHSNPVACATPDGKHFQIQVLLAGFSQSKHSTQLNPQGDPNS